jgi:hypothetical protein
VRFVPVSVREYERLASGVSQGALRFEPVGEVVGAAA